MANTSILTAFERMWQHIVASLGNKQDKITVSGLLKGDGESVSVAKVWDPIMDRDGDYLAPENIGVPGGVARLDGSGRIMPEQHMRTVDVLEDWLYEGELDIGANGLFLRSPNADDTTIILPMGLPKGMEVTICRSGQGAVNFVAGEGVALKCASDNPCIVHPNGVVHLKCLTSTEHAAVWVVYGDITDASSSTLNTTLIATNWSNKQYTISNENITSTNIVELIPQSSITLEQYEALAGAIIIGGEQTEGSIVLTALGDVPAVDIPVILVFRSDI